MSCTNSVYEFTYTYGARWYDATGRLGFTTMDPLCEEGYSVSPYVYCRDNPINAVDPDGKYIVYFNSIDEKTYIYYQGNFYNNSTTVKDGNRIPNGFPVYVKPTSNNLMYQTLKALRSMEYSKDENIRTVFRTLSNLNSNKKHAIMKGNSDRGSYTHPAGGGNTITYLNHHKDMQSDDFKGIGLTYYELIGHELKHAYDMEFHKDSSIEDKNGIKYDEYKTVNFENLIRKEEGNPLRETYGSIYIPNEMKSIITIWK